MKTVYVGLCADGLHHGHINIIERARELGEVTVGLLTDEAIASYKRYPLIKFEDRRRIIANIVGVELIVPQTTLDYVPNLLRFKPDFVIHGTDWADGVQRETRQNVLDALKIWGGQLVELPYTENISSTDLKKYWGEK